MRHLFVFSAGFCLFIYFFICEFIYVYLLIYLLMFIYLLVFQQLMELLAGRAPSRRQHSPCQQLLQATGSFWPFLLGFV